MEPLITENEIEYVLMDIEGTLSDINFVKGVMFPYSAEKLPSYIRKNAQSQFIQDAIAKASEEEEIQLEVEGFIELLLKWIDDDIKHPILKSLQGKVWKEGFETHLFKAPLYSDVLPAWKRWSEMGITLGIYSSGSVGSQQLFFSYSEYGDVTHYLKDLFDLGVGSKKEAISYKNILNQIGFENAPEKVLFLSDIEDELNAAKTAGLGTCQILRPGINKSQKHHVVKTMNELD